MTNLHPNLAYSYQWMVCVQPSLSVPIPHLVFESGWQHPWVGSLADAVVVVAVTAAAVAVAVAVADVELDQ